MFFLKYKIHIILFSTIISLFVSLFVLYINAIRNLEKEKQKNLYLENSLKTQNEAIKKIQIDTQAFNANVDKLESEVRNKYEAKYETQNSEYENKEISTNSRYKSNTKHSTNSIQKQSFTIPINNTSYSSVNNANSQDRIKTNKDINILLHENIQLQKEIQTAKSLLKIRLE